MHRRTLLSRVSAAAAGALLGPRASTAGGRLQDQAGRAASSGTVTEPAREVPVVATADVAVVGGGPAGVAAAVAVRKGSSVQEADVARIRALLAQQKAYLG
jgi:hypothetical protein